MAPNGRVCVVGSRGEVKINPRDLMTKELEVFRMSLKVFHSTFFHC